LQQRPEIVVERSELKSVAFDDGRPGSFTTSLTDRRREAAASGSSRGGHELQVHGSANLIQTLLLHEVIGGLRLWTFPVIVVRGKRLFSDGTIPAGLKLVDSTVSSTGVRIGTYVPAGEVVTGSFALDEPTDSGTELIGIAFSLAATRQKLWLTQRSVPETFNE